MILEKLSLYLTEKYSSALCETEYSLSCSKKPIICLHIFAGEHSPKTTALFLQNYSIFSYHIVQPVRQTTIFMNFHQNSLWPTYLFALSYRRWKVKIYYDSRNYLSHLWRRLQRWKCIIENVLTCISRMTILCNIMFAVVQQL